MRGASIAAPRGSGEVLPRSGGPRSEGARGDVLKDDFPQIWVPSWENRDLRQLLWHRHRMVQVRTRIMNQLQALALNEGLRCKKRLWRENGRRQLEAVRLGPWASPRRRRLVGVL